MSSTENVRHLLDSGFSYYCIIEESKCKKHPEYIVLIRRSNKPYLPLGHGEHLKLAVLVCSEHLNKAVAKYQLMKAEVLAVFQITDVTGQVLHPEDLDDGDSL